MGWHEEEVETVLHRVSANSSAVLTQEQAQERLKKHGKNVPVTETKSSFFLLFFAQFKSFIVLVLCAAAVIAVEIQKTIIAAELREHDLSNLHPTRR